MSGVKGQKWSSEKLANHINGEYYGLDRYALQHFKGCHDRVRDGKSPSIYWSRDRKGYIEFCKELGPIPSCLIVPSVGRKDHKLGYIPGNVQWEEHSVNSVKRRGTKYENETSSTIA